MKKTIHKHSLLSLSLFLLINLTQAQCFQSFSCGDYHIAALRTDNTITLCGYNDWGQLGNNSNTNSNIFIVPNTATDWKFITCGGISTFAIKNNGTLWATGNDQYGSLGDGTFGFANTFNHFIQIGTSQWKTIAAGNDNTVGIQQNGTLWGWGINTNGQVGDGTTIDRYTPVQISTDTDWKTLIIGNGNFVFAQKNNGTLWGWGLNSCCNLGLGIGANSYYYTPTQIGTDTDWKTLDAGWSHSLAIKNDGTLYVFGGGIGAGQYGETGLSTDNTLFPQYPRQIGSDTNWVAVSAALYTSFAIKTDGTLWGWGRNNYNQMGDGTTDNKYLPTQIGTDTDWASVSAGQRHIAAMKTNGDFYTWGDNSVGQLGNGTTTNLATPTSVAISGCNLANETFTKESIVFNITPNPASSQINIAYKGNQLINTIVIYDLNGKLVHSSNPVTTNTLNATLSIADLASGNYVVVLKNNDTTVTSSKIIKE